MIIEFHIDDSLYPNEVIVYYSERFPITDFKVGDYIWFSDFKPFLKVGFFYLPEECDFLDIENATDYAQVTKVAYAFSKGEVVKIVNLIST